MVSYHPTLRIFNDGRVEAAEMQGAAAEPERAWSGGKVAHTSLDS